MPQAQPGDYDTTPDQDTDYSNADLTAPHHVPSDGPANGGFDATDKTRQYPFAEQGVRATETSSG